MSELKDPKWCTSLAFRLGFVSTLVKKGFTSKEIESKIRTAVVMGPTIDPRLLSKEKQLVKWGMNPFAWLFEPHKRLFNMITTSAGLSMLALPFGIAVARARLRRARRKLREAEAAAEANKIMNALAIARAYDVAAERLELANRIKQEREIIQAERRRGAGDRVEIT